MLNSGNSVLVVLCTDDRPSAKVARVERTSPLTLLVPADSESGSNGLNAGDRVTLIASSNDSEAYAEAAVKTVTKYGLSHLVEVEAEPFIRFDRRRGERYDVALPGTIGVVQNGIEAARVSHSPMTVINLSPVGAWIKTEAPIERGSLVSVAISDPMHEDEFKMLGLITRVGDGNQGAAIEFFDFIGSSRFRLASYLRSLPKAA